MGYQFQRVFEGEKILATDVDSLDITDKEQVDKVFSEFKPDLVLHGAAYTNVDGAETDEKTAFRVNEEGTRNLAQAAKAIGVKLVYISTDFVFDGEKGSLYQEEDKTNALNVYGKSKLEGEKAVESVGGDYIIARTAWLYGENGKNFVETMIKLGQEKPELQVVDDQVGSPTYTKDLAQAVKQLVDKGASGTFHVVNKGECSWFEFAKEILRLAGINTPVKAIKSTELARPAKRPAYTALDTDKLGKMGIEMRKWQAALKDYIENRKG